MITLLERGVSGAVEGHMLLGRGSMAVLGAALMVSSGMLVSSCASSPPVASSDGSAATTGVAHTKGLSTLPATTGSGSTTTAPAPTSTSTSTFTSTPSSITGLGATLSAFSSSHQPGQGKYDGLPAFGSILTTPEGPTPQFIGIQSAGGHVTQFIEVLATSTSLTEAKAAVSPQLPPGWTADSFLIDLHGSTTGESCAFWNLTVPALMSAVPTDAANTAAVTIEMAYDNTDGVPYWKATDINTLTFEFGHQTQTGTC